jgi:hypothetical protein
MREHDNKNGGRSRTGSLFLSRYVIFADNPSPALIGYLNDKTAAIEVTITGVNAAGGDIYSAVNNGDGQWTIDRGVIKPLSDGKYDMVAVATDWVGNFAKASATLTIDAPSRISTFSVTPEAISPNGDGTNDSASIEVSFSEHSVFSVNIMNGDEVLAHWDGNSAEPQNFVWAPESVADGSYTIEVAATDDSGHSATYTPGVVVVDDTPPVLTLSGDAEIKLCQGASYNELGASSADSREGNLTSSIEITGSVNETVPGAYEITYKSSDVAGNIATSSRFVTVLASDSSECSLAAGGGESTGPETESAGGLIEPTPTQAPVTNAVHGTAYPISLSVPATITTVAAPSSQAVTGQVLGASTFRFENNLGIGSRGEDVRQMQKRLFSEGLFAGPVTGYYWVLTRAAVKQFQAEHGIPTTGFVGVLTRAALNE